MLSGTKVWLPSSGKRTERKILRKIYPDQRSYGKSDVKKEVIVVVEGVAITGVFDLSAAGVEFVYNFI